MLDRSATSRETPPTPSLFGSCVATTRLILVSPTWPCPRRCSTTASTPSRLSSMGSTGYVSAWRSPSAQDLDSARHLNEVLDQHLEPDQMYRSTTSFTTPLTRRLRPCVEAVVLRGLGRRSSIESLRIWSGTRRRARRSSRLLRRHRCAGRHAAEPPPAAARRRHDGRRGRRSTLARSAASTCSALSADPARSRRARYTQGSGRRRPVPSLRRRGRRRPPSRAPRPWSEIELRIDDRGGAHLPVTLRSGKALGEDRAVSSVGAAQR
jgi:hypothetical protein